MAFEIIRSKQGAIAEISAPTTEFNLEDFIDIIGNLKYQGIHKLIIYKTNLTPSFFDLKTKIAGDILQKFSTYNVQLAIVGDFKKINSTKLKEFMRESNSIGQVLFLEHRKDAIIQLT